MAAANASSPEPDFHDPRFARYARQARFAPLGLDGQQKLTAAHCLIVGCGALGSVAANLLARAGIGKLRLVDRDFLELSNLQRQDLYTERDVAEGLPKSVAAAQHLKQINSNVAVEPIVADLDFANAHRFARDIHLIIDGTDNFESRFLINDLAVEQGIPWIFGGCVGAEGQSMTIIPGQTPCLLCLMSAGPPPPGTTATCDTAGILASVSTTIAAIQVCEAIKILSGNADSINRKLSVIDLWDSGFRQLDLSSLMQQRDCRCCQQRQFDWLSGNQASRTAVLCGRNSVQVSSPSRTELSLEQLARQLEPLGVVQRNPFLLRFFAADFSLTVFDDGRAIIGGTEDIARAKSIYAQYVGN